jgi:hypothetical protein
MLQEDIRTKRPTIPLNDPPDAPKKLCDSPDFKWYLIDQINIYGKNLPSPKRFLMVREWPENGLTQARSIRSEIISATMTIGHNQLIINDISTLIESTYKYFTETIPKKNDYC